MSTHAELAPSAAHRWLNCPGSIALARDIPEQTPGDAAIEGTAAHEVAEKCLKAKNVKEMSPSFYIGQKIKINKNEIEITKEMADKISIYTEYIKTNFLKKDWDIWEVEVKNPSPIHKNCWGTADFVAGNFFGVLHIIDFKFGINVVVEPENNSQLLIYAMGAMKKWGPFEKVIMTIIQPRAYHENGSVRSWELGANEFRQIYLDYRKAAEKVYLKNPPINSGDWCQWCPAAGQCPALYDKTLEIAKSDFSDDSSLPEIGALSIDKIAKIIEHKKSIESFLKAAEYRALQLMTEGKMLPGLKLVHKRSSTKWRDEIEAKKKLIPALSSACLDQKLKTPNKIKKEFGAEYLEGLIEKIEGALTVVPENDRRNAAITSAQEDFK